MILCEILLWKLFENRLRNGYRLIYLAVFAWNPTTISVAGSVMSEPLFLTVTLLSFIAQDRLGRVTKTGWLLGAAMGLAMLIRPESVALVFAILLGLLYDKDWPDIRRTLPGLCLAAAILCSFLLSSTANSNYLAAYQRNLDALGPHYMLTSAASLALTLFAGAMLALPMPTNAQFYMLGWVFACTCASFCAFGLRRASEHEKRQGLLLSLFCFCAAFFMIHAIHSVINRRYLWVLVPFVLFFLVLGVQEWLSGRVLARRTQMLIASPTLIFCFANSLLAAIRPPPPRTAFPSRTFEWIQSHISPDEQVLTLWPDTLRLYTNARSRFPAISSTPNDAAAFRYRMIADGVAYLLYQETVTTNNLPQDRKAFDSFLKTQPWASSWPAAFDRVFENDREGTILYRVVSDSRFQPAYLAYLLGLENLQQGNNNLGIAAIRRSLRLDPNLPDAWNAYGAALLTQDQDLPTAEKYFARAIRLRPSYALPALNLARLYAKQGFCKKADRYYDQGIAEMTQTREFDSLIPQAQSEKLAMDSGSCGRSHHL